MLLEPLASLIIRCTWKTSTPNLTDRGKALVVKIHQAIRYLKSPGSWESSKIGSHQLERWNDWIWSLFFCSNFPVPWKTIVIPLNHSKWVDKTFMQRKYMSNTVHVKKKSMFFRLFTSQSSKRILNPQLSVHLSRSSPAVWSVFPTCCGTTLKCDAHWKSPAGASPLRQREHIPWPNRSESMAILGSQVDSWGTPLIETINIVTALQTNWEKNGHVPKMFTTALISLLYKMGY